MFIVIIIMISFPISKYFKNNLKQEDMSMV